MWRQVSVQPWPTFSWQLGEHCMLAHISELLVGFQSETGRIIIIKSIWDWKIATIYCYKCHYRAYAWSLTDGMWEVLSYGINYHMTLGLVQKKARKTSFQKSIYFQSLLTELSLVLPERSPSLSLSLLLLPDKGGLLCLQDKSHHLSIAAISLDSIFGFQFQRQQNLGNIIFFLWKIMTHSYF